jgi:uncharacterized protein (TIGR00251 family)
VDRCYRLVPGGIVLTVRLTPKSSRDAVEGIARLADGRAVAQARVRPVPEKGAANQALLVLLARVFGVSKSAVELAGGSTGRLKQVRISGEPAALAAVADGWQERQA